MAHLHKTVLTASALLALALLAVSGLIPASAAEPGNPPAAPQLQPTTFPTPTPGSDGRIIYIVQPGDTLWRIAAISGLRMEELIGLNGLNPEDPVIVPGQALLLGLGGPSEPVPTPGPSPSPTSILPTPEAQPGTGTVCITLFEDTNGDATRQEAEPAIAGGAISISNRAGSASQTGTTRGGLDEEGEVVRDCFEGLPQGDYNISVAVPEDYNPTTELNYTLKLEAGDETLLGFGAQLNSQGLVESLPVEAGGRSPLLGIVGVVILLAGLALGVFAGRLSRRRLL